MRHTANPVAPRTRTSAGRGSLVTLRDGSKIIVRPVRVADGPAVQAFLERRSLNARRLRFFSAARNPSVTDNGTASADPDARFGLIALRQQYVVGHAAYVRMYGSRAEVAVEVADSMHHLGLGTRLVTRLAKVAQQRGISHFVAEVLAENSEMLAVFNDGFAPVHRHDDGVVEIEFPTANWKLAYRRAHAGQARLANRDD